MGKEAHAAGEKEYIKRQIVMLTIFFQNCKFIHNSLFLL
jgi:hypothetical protein